MSMPFIRNRYETIPVAALLARWLLIASALGGSAVWAQSRAVEQKGGAATGLPVQIESELAGAEREVALRQLMDRVNRQILEMVELADDVNFAYDTIRTIPTPPGSRSPEVL